MFSRYVTQSITLVARLNSTICFEYTIELAILSPLERSWHEKKKKKKKTTLWKINKEKK